MQVRTQIHPLEPIILSVGIPSRNNKFDSRVERLEAQRDLLVACIGTRHDGGRIQVGVPHVGHIFVAGKGGIIDPKVLLLTAGIVRADRIRRMRSLVDTGCYRSLMLRPVNNETCKAASRGQIIIVIFIILHFWTGIHRVEAARILGSAPVEVVVFISACRGGIGRISPHICVRVGKTLDFLRVIVSIRQVFIGAELLPWFCVDLHKVPGIGRGFSAGNLRRKLGVPVDALVADVVQDDGLVVPRISGFGEGLAVICPAHVGVQAEADHGVVLREALLSLFGLQLMLLLLHAGKRREQCHRYS